MISLAIILATIVCVYSDITVATISNWAPGNSTTTALSNLVSYNFTYGYDTGCMNFVDCISLFLDDPNVYLGTPKTTLDWIVPDTPYTYDGKYACNCLLGIMCPQNYYCNLDIPLNTNSTSYISTLADAGYYVSVTGNSVNYITSMTDLNLWLTGYKEIYSYDDPSSPPNYQYDLMGKVIFECSISIGSQVTSSYLENNVAHSTCDFFTSWAF